MYETKCRLKTATKVVFLLNGNSFFFFIYNNWGSFATGNLFPSEESICNNIYWLSSGEALNKYVLLTSFKHKTEVASLRYCN